MGTKREYYRLIKKFFRLRKIIAQIIKDTGTPLPSNQEAVDTAWGQAGEQSSGPPGHRAVGGDNALAGSWA